MGAGSCSGYFLDYLNGFAADSGSGPWANSSYVASTDSGSVAGAFWGMNPEFRSDGPTYDTGTLPADIRGERGCRSSANVLTVNACSSVRGSHDDNRSRAFEDLVDETAEHEIDHVEAVVDEAGSHDVWGDWEAVVAASESALRTTAQTIGAEAQAALLSATQAVDAAESGTERIIWWWFGSDWDRAKMKAGQGHD